MEFLQLVEKAFNSIRRSKSRWLIDLWPEDAKQELAISIFENGYNLRVQEKYLKKLLRRNGFLRSRTGGKIKWLSEHSYLKAVSLGHIDRKCYGSALRSKARMKISPQRRSEIAKIAVMARIAKRGF